MIKIVKADREGKIVLTEEELDELLKQSFNEGKESVEKDRVYLKEWDQYENVPFWNNEGTSPLEYEKVPYWMHPGFKNPGPTCDTYNTCTTCQTDSTNCTNCKC